MKKVLVITYYWPPAGGPGVQRVLKFVKYLPQFGYEPIVLTVENGEYPAIDESLQKDVPTQLKVYNSRAWSPYQLFRKSTSKDKSIDTFVLDDKKPSLKMRLAYFLRQEFFIPDARIGWVNSATKLAKKIIDKEGIDLVFSSSPPHSLQLIAKRIKSAANLPWVADFRDPWTDAFWEQNATRSKRSAARNLRLEQNVLSTADGRITVSQGVADLLDKNKSRKYHLIPNGFDQADFNDLIREENRDEVLRITYTGSIAQSQVPDNVLEAIAALNKRNIQVELHLYGKADATFFKKVKALKLGDCFVHHGYISHDEVLQKMLDADVLLLLIPRDHGKGILSGKLYEYLATGNYILGVGDSTGAAAEVLHETSSGKMIDFETSASSLLNELLERKKNGRLRTQDTQSIQQYTREFLTSQLAQIFDEVCP